ncbi:hypothetical protein EGR_04336 [Echinococcus granulosus]|uniref:Uncharacterized protein n=1 Tax=Echinococcus granulosus TaxID=6210 RepID=W6UGR7_ECHGR|nr:hypothetical protein EGR_04336 [Echinococcus granulosus]EUB60710.1 hypothetical protein EGR_04336 [Echinococcus granulosus]
MSCQRAEVIGPLKPSLLSAVTTALLRVLAKAVASQIIESPIILLYHIYFGLILNAKLNHLNVFLTTAKTILIFSQMKYLFPRLNLFCVLHINGLKRLQKFCFIKLRDPKYSFLIQDTAIWHMLLQTQLVLVNFVGVSDFKLLEIFHGAIRSCSSIGATFCSLYRLKLITSCKFCVYSGIRICRHFLQTMAQKCCKTSFRTRKLLTKNINCELIVIPPMHFVILFIFLLRRVLKKHKKQGGKLLDYWSLRKENKCLVGHIIPS